VKQAPSSSVSGPAVARDAYDVEALRARFPALHQEVNGHPLVYLDNAATTQKPRAVIDALESFYLHDCANIHRGVHALSVRATDAYEGARRKLQRFIGAASPSELVFVRGTTEAINLVAQAFARPRLEAGDEILITHIEHHANIVPWQLVCGQTGAKLRVAPVDDRGALDLDAFGKLCGPRTKIVAIGHVSNALGTIHPVEELAQQAHAVGATVVVDGAQAAPHLAIDVRALGVDFYAFSGHKMYGPTGIGVLWGRETLLEEMPPYQGGGEMIRSVRFEETLYNELPHKFEAGTPHISGAIGMGAAADFLAEVGTPRVARHEERLLARASAALSAIPGVRLIGTAPHKAAVLSFVLDGVHPHDVGTILDQEGIAVRTGNHCAQPAIERFGIPATVRASFALYSTEREVDALAAALVKVKEVFA
jgi:cysteine desulfurase/selenocysteine lyase